MSTEIYDIGINSLCSLDDGDIIDRQNREVGVWDRIREMGIFWRIHIGRRDLKIINKTITKKILKKLARNINN